MIKGTAADQFSWGWDVTMGKYPINVNIDPFPPLNPT